MSLHLIKLCVGIETADHLAEVQARRLEQARARGEPGILRHITRSTPRRADELVDGGSMYWVIRGHIRVRQAIAGIEPAVNANGQAACAIVLSPDLVRLVPRPQRAFQGWRYLDGADAPADAAIDASGLDSLPDGLAEELRELGLI